MLCGAKDRTNLKSSHQGANWSERETKLDQELERKVESNGSGKSGDKTPEEIILNTWRSN